MSNEYFTKTVEAVPYNKAKASELNTPLTQLEAAFDKLVDPHPSKQGFGAPVPVSDATALDEAVTAEQIIQSELVYAADTGVANAYVVDLAIAPSALVDGVRVLFKALNANTGACTINVNSLGVKALKDSNGVALEPDNIAAGAVVEAIYNSGEFRIPSLFAQHAAAAVASAAEAEAYAIDAAASADDAEDSADEAAASAISASLSASNADTTFATHLKYQW